MRGRSTWAWIVVTVAILALGRMAQGADGPREAEYRAVVRVHVRLGDREATGSGVIVSQEGHVLTAEHVVGCFRTVLRPRPSCEYQVELDGKTYDAVLLYLPEANGRDEVAVLRMEGAPQPLPSLPVALTPPRVGDRVRAYGYPIGAELAYAAGRVTKVDGDTISTSFFVIEGTSGGPLLNDKGEVVGIASTRAPLPGDLLYRPKNEERSQFVGGRLLREALRYVRGAREMVPAGQRQLVIFVSSSCGPCWQLKSDLAAGRIRVPDGWAVVVAEQSTDQWANLSREFTEQTGQRVEDVGVPVVWLRGTNFYRVGYDGDQEALTQWLSKATQELSAEVPAPPPPKAGQGALPSPSELLAEIRELKSRLEQLKRDYEQFRDGGVIGKIKGAVALKSDAEALKAEIGAVRGQLDGTAQRLGVLQQEVSEAKQTGTRVAQDLHTLRTAELPKKLGAVARLARDVSDLRRRVLTVRGLLPENPLAILISLIGLVTGFAHRKWAG